MKLGRALNVVRYQQRALGRSGVHCSEPMCVVCALLTINAELEFQWNSHRDPKTAGQRPSSSREYCFCGLKLVDGICSNCNG